MNFKTMMSILTNTDASIAARGVLAYSYIDSFKNECIDEKMRQYRVDGLKELLSHFYEHSEFVQKRINDSGFSITQISEDISKIDIMKRFDFQENDFSKIPYPESHGDSIVCTSSGSTGIPVQIKKTDLCRILWNTNTIRYHKMFNTGSLSGGSFKRIFSIRANIEKKEYSGKPGFPANCFFGNADTFVLPSSKNVAGIIEELYDKKPDYLIINPTVLLDIINSDDSRVPEILNNLRQVSTVSENVPKALIEYMDQKQKHISFSDMYGTQEHAYVAVMCNKTRLYHVMNESLIVEIIDPETNNPCAEGDVGKIVITDLFNYATPVIRYENGDWAEVGPVCTCGAYGQTIRKIYGRTRNMLKLPDGSKQWPVFGVGEFINVAGLKQFQITQNMEDALDLHLAFPDKMNLYEISKSVDVISKIIREKLNYNFKFYIFLHSDYISGFENKKFEEFICNI